MGDDKYYKEPYSTFHLTQTTRTNILILAALGALSSLTTFVVVAIIIRRLVVWRKQYRQFIRQNQCVVLVLNLFLADSITGAGASLGFRWIKVGGILAPTSWCWAQAGLLHIGNLASGFFVLALGLQTLATFVLERAISFGKFCFGVVFIWVLAVLLTIVGPLQHGATFFERTEDWCWISERYNFERLWLQYLWVRSFIPSFLDVHPAQYKKRAAESKFQVFIVEFSTVVIYGGLYFHLSRRLTILRAIRSTENMPKRLVTAMRLMALYPLTYVALTFPIAFSRMQILAGYKPPNTQIVVAAALVSSCGWVDAILYSFTRRVLIHTGPEDAETLQSPSSETETPPAAGGSELLDWPVPSSRRTSGISKWATANLDPRFMQITATMEIDVYEKEPEATGQKSVAPMESNLTMQRNWYPV